MAADLALDTAPRLLAPSLYRVDLPVTWNFRNPSGGVLMTAALRAAGVELGDPELQLRSATTVFSSVVLAGALDIRVRVIRRGGATAQVHVSLANPGATDTGLELVATFGRARDEGPEFIDVEPPVVPSPAEAPLLHTATPISRRFVPPIFRNAEMRLALGHPWWDSGWPAGPARLARWMRYHVPQRLADGRLDPLALPPLVDTMPPSTIQKLGPGFTPFIAPSLDLTLHVLAPTRSDWLLLDTHTRHAGAGYGAADVHVWDEDRRLVAFATQMWMFRKAPPGHEEG
jgi:acyl-CoA thioesterase